MACSTEPVLPMVLAASEKGKTGPTRGRLAFLLSNIRSESGALRKLVEGTKSPKANIGPTGPIVIW